MLDYVERTAKRTVSERSALDTVKALFAGQGDETELFQHPERLLAQFPECRAYYAELDALLALPYDQFATAETALRQKYQHNSVVKLFAPALGRARETAEKLVCKRALLRAAIQIVADGKTDAANTTDPYAAKASPFGYSVVPGGFELSSAFQSSGKPVTLRCAPFVEPVPANEPVKPPAPPKKEENGNF
jgi:hypothetical protein